MEPNKNPQGADYLYDTPDSEPGETDMPTPPIESHSTCKDGHYWTDQGLQPTGERLIRCRDCGLGMERLAGVKAVDGKMVEP